MLCQKQQLISTVLSFPFPIPLFTIRFYPFPFQKQPKQNWVYFARSLFTEIPENAVPFATGNSIPYVERRA